MRIRKCAQDYSTSEYYEGTGIIECEVNGNPAYYIESRELLDEWRSTSAVCWVDEERNRVFVLRYSWPEDEDKSALTLDDLIAMAQSVTEA